MKGLLIRVCNFYIQASLHVALAVVSLVYVFMLSMKASVDEDLLKVIFFGTITGYNFVKYATVAKLYHSSLTRSLRIIQLFSLVSFLTMCIYAIGLPIRTLLVFASIGFFTLLYAVPLVASKNVRSISGLKIYVVAICWTLTAVVVPTVHYNFSFDILILIKCIQIFSLVIALVIPFDIRDLRYDNKSLSTIPQQLGVKKAKLIAMLLILLFGILEINNTNRLSLLGVLPICTLSLYLIYKIDFSKSKYYCSFFVESMPVVYAISVIILLCF